MNLGLLVFHHDFIDLVSDLLCVYLVAGCWGWCALWRSCTSSVGNCSSSLQAWSICFFSGETTMWPRDLQVSKRNYFPISWKSNFWVGILKIKCPMLLREVIFNKCNTPVEFSAVHPLGGLSKPDFSYFLWQVCFDGDGPGPAWPSHRDAHWSPSKERL